VHGSQCAELDALSATELRRRVEEAILKHVDMEKWDRLQEVERIEKQSVANFLSGWTDREETDDGHCQQ
jgi:hypothetical protein